MTTLDDHYDEEQEDYANLADEVNDPCECGEGSMTGDQHHEAHCPARPWNEADWDERAVASAKRYAEKNDLPWPPSTGDFDRWYERQHNGG